METSQTERSIDTNIITDPLIKKWSWGAFILDPFFILAVRKYIYLLLYLLYIVPILNILAMIGIKIFLGMKGTDMVRESETFENDDERRGFLKAINHAGFILFIITLIFFAIGFALISLLGYTFFSAYFYQ